MNTLELNKAGYRYISINLQASIFFVFQLNSQHIIAMGCLAPVLTGIIGICKLCDFEPFLAFIWEFSQLYSYMFVCT